MVFSGEMFSLISAANRLGMLSTLKAGSCGDCCEWLTACTCCCCCGVMVFSGDTFTFRTFSSSFEDLVHVNSPPMGLSFREGGCDEELFSFAVPELPPPVVAVPHSELGGLDLLEENRLLGLKMDSSFSMAGE